ncbi:MAG TPA: hypothetical protein PKG56_00605 [Chitinophagaceae bacterium]|nr:hypothetical protein [Chitinophagaceae bacterium]MCC6634752.1 hypothetical protein [Chitinophagaceae bacterium]HMZ45922.1 hypothetical protein [Chitinophagaceae bacterium]HNE94041.1 hypothetical protein [Chitinophagaceae bacterium]HNF30228.1 hypothetical protein [Chitinophagaceae bacterium]
MKVYSFIIIAIILLSCLVILYKSFLIIKQGLNKEYNIKGRELILYYLLIGLTLLSVMERHFENILRD